MNKKELRNKFFKEHTYKCENGIPRVITHPHNLFEWMYEQLTLTNVNQQRELLKIPKTTKEQRVQLNEGYKQSN